MPKADWIKTVRQAGEIVNNHEIKGLNADNQWGNYYDYDMYGTTSSPIFAEHNGEFHFGDVAQEELFTFEDYGFAQIFVTLKRLGFPAAWGIGNWVSDFSIIVVDTNGIEMFNTDSITISLGSIWKYRQSHLVELWAPVKPGYKAYIRSVSGTGQAAVFPYSAFYRLHNTAAQAVDELDEDYNHGKSILGMMNGLATNIISNKITRPEHNATGNVGDDDYSSTNGSVIQSSLEADRHSPIWEAGGGNHKFQMKKNGFCEVQGVLSGYFTITTSITISHHRDGDTLKTVVRTIEHPFVSGTPFSLSNMYSAPVLEGDEIWVTVAGVSTGTFNCQYFNYPSYKEFDIDYDSGDYTFEADKKEMLITKLNNKVTNGLGIEMIEKSEEGPKSLRVSGTRSVHTTPWVSGLNETSVIDGTKTYHTTIPSDGMYYSKLVDDSVLSGFLWVDHVVEISIYDENDNRTAHDEGHTMILAVEWNDVLQLPGRISTIIAEATTCVTEIWNPVGWVACGVAATAIALLIADLTVRPEETETSIGLMAEVEKDTYRAEHRVYNQGWFDISAVSMTSLFHKIDGTYINKGNSGETSSETNTTPNTSDPDNGI